MQKFILKIFRGIKFQKCVQCECFEFWTGDWENNGEVDVYVFNENFGYSDLCREITPKVLGEMDIVEAKCNWHM